MSWQRRRIRERNPPAFPHRTWPRLHAYEHDPRFEVLMPCAHCGRKVGEGPLKALRIWRVTPRRESRGRVRYENPDVSPVERLQRPVDRWRWDWWLGPLWSWNTAVVECADTRECQAHVEGRERKKREAQERRRPRLPHADAPPGTCKWCGEGIEFDETQKGWKRCRQRGYHRGDAMELGDKNCLLPAMVWLDPKRGMQTLLRRQEGKCTVCGEQIGELTNRQNYDDLEGETTWWRPTANIDIDHVVPVVEGGENRLENLQAICNTPCHKAKTAREAKARAKARKAGLPPPEPVGNPNQLEMA